MRADAHYVDHLESRQPGPYAWLDPKLIETSPAAEETPLGDLVASIQRHGVLQPLLVQQRDGQHRLISGRRRRQAAILAGIRRVPCVVHAVDDEEAHALRAAAAIKLHPAPPAASAAFDTAPDVTRSLETLMVYSSLLASEPSDLSRHLSADVIAAEAWRSFCIVEATRVAQHGIAASRKLVQARHIAETLARSVAAECRLRNVALEVAVEVPGGRMVLADDRAMVVALSGAVLATLALFERGHRAALNVAVSVRDSGQLVFEVSQGAIGVAETWASRAFDRDWIDRPGGAAALAAMVAVKKIGEAFGGTVSVAALRRGTSVTLTMPML
jgi:hypothetical protein